MTPLDRNRLFAKFDGNPPSGADAISLVEAASGLCLPADYATFLQRMNGGEGFIGNSYVILWRVEELLERNKAYQVTDFARGLFLFGSDGGGEAFAFDMRSDVRPIVSVPFVGMDLNSAGPVAQSFGAFLERLAKS